MDRLVDLLVDNTSVLGRLVTSAAIVAVAAVAAEVLGRLFARRGDDAYSRYYARKSARYAVAVLALVGVAIVWRAFAGRAGVVLGLAAAGIAFAMQETIGALAGFVNILSGKIFRVGDRVQMGGVRGDVIDISPLRTKIMEIGSANDDGTWVRGRQYTGRIVSVSNKATFTDPVFNYSAVFHYIWDELNVPVAHGDDWQQAEAILRAEAERVSATHGAQQAIREMLERYPVAATEVEPRVFARMTDNYMELSARFVVPVRTARSVKDELTRRVHEQLDEAGIAIASTTQDVTVKMAGDSPGG